MQRPSALVTLPNFLGGLEAAHRVTANFLDELFISDFFALVFCLSSLSFFLLGGISRTKTKFELILYLVEPPHADVCSSYVQVKFIFSHMRGLAKNILTMIWQQMFARQTADPRPTLRVPLG